MAKPPLQNLAEGNGRVPASSGAITIDPEADEITGAGQAAALAAFRELDPPADLLGAPEPKDVRAVRPIPPVHNRPGGAVAPDYEELEADLGGLAVPFIPRPRRVESLPPVGGDWRDTIKEHFPQEERSPQAQAAQPNPTIVAGEDGDWPLVDDRTDETAPPTGKAETDPVTASGAPPVITMRPAVPKHVRMTARPRDPVVNNTRRPPPGIRRVKIKIEEILPIDPLVDTWVCGTMPVGKLVTIGEGRHREVLAAYLAARVTKVDGNMVWVKIFCGPFSEPHRFEELLHKLERDKQARKRQLLKALAEDLNRGPLYVDREILMLAGPPVATADIAGKQYGYHVWPGPYLPPIKVQVGKKGPKVATELMILHHAEVKASGHGAFLRWLCFGQEKRDAFNAIERGEVALPPTKRRTKADRDEADARALILEAVAKLAQPVMSSLWSIAFKGRQLAEVALAAAGSGVVATYFTQYDDEPEQLGPYVPIEPILDEPQPKK